MKNAEIKQFYKDLYRRMNEILKPHGFSRKGNSFRRLSDEGVIGEIEIQRNESGAIGSYSFTVNINADLLDISGQPDPWEKKFLAVRGLLGEPGSDRWRIQKWYWLDLWLHPHLREQIRDGRFPLRSKEEGKDWHTTWIPAPDFEEIITEVCELSEHKAVPFLLSVQIREEFLKLLEASETDREFTVRKDNDTIRSFAKIYGPEFLPMLSAYIKTAEDILASDLSRDVSREDAMTRQFQEKSISMMREKIKELYDLASDLKEGI